MARSCRWHLLHCFTCFILISCIAIVGYIVSSEDNFLQVIQTRLNSVLINYTATTKKDNNSNTITFFIGTSPMKCASSTIHHSLLLALKDIEHQYSNYHPITGVRSELHYWDKCIIDSNQSNQCSLTQYFKLFNFSSILNQSYQTKQEYIFLEKTPSLLKYYHSAYLLSHYSKLYHDIYFYISLRNPIDRLWSHYWMDHRRTYDRNDTNDIKRMMDRIVNDLHSFSNNYPKYQKVIDKIESNANDTEIIKSYIVATYDITHHIDYDVLMQTDKNVNDILTEIKKVSLKNIPLMISCYYPQLIMWYLLLKSNMNQIQIGERVKIFQMEWIYDANIGIHKVLRKLLGWIGNDIEYMIDAYFDNRNHHDMAYFFSRNDHLSSYSPVSMKLDNTTLKIELDKFYHSCNQKLYEFLGKHSELLLLDAHFDFDA